MKYGIVWHFLYNSTCIGFSYCSVMFSLSQSRNKYDIVSWWLEHLVWTIFLHIKLFGLTCCFQEFFALRMYLIFQQPKNVSYISAATAAICNIQFLAWQCFWNKRIALPHRCGKAANIPMLRSQPFLNFCNLARNISVRTSVTGGSLPGLGKNLSCAWFSVASNFLLTIFGNKYKIQDTRRSWCLSCHEDLRTDNACNSSELVDNFRNSVYSSMQRWPDAAVLENHGPLGLFRSSFFFGWEHQIKPDRGQCHCIKYSIVSRSL